MIDLISGQTGMAVRPIGLGAGSDAYLHGSAASQGHERGGADLEIVGMNIQIEVTGPLVNSVTPDAALWLRPDKIENARSHLATTETWVVHHLPRTDLLRVIGLNDAFFRYLGAGAFPIVNPYIRGTRETYRAIPARHPVVQPFSVLIERLRDSAL